MRDFGQPPEVRELPRKSLFAQLPEQVVLQVLRPELSGAFRCRVIAAQGAFLTLAGLQHYEKPFFLQVGSEIILGFAWLEGWAQLAGEVVGWSAASMEHQMMINCRTSGRLIQRRRQLRLPEALPLAFLNSEGDAHLGQARNLSRNGLCALFAAPLPEQMGLDLQLLPHRSLPISLRGNLIWQRPAGVVPGSCLAGIAFQPSVEIERQRYLALLAKIRRSRVSGAGSGLR